MRFSVLAVLLAFVCFVSGCNREPFSYVHVRGKVCYEDGSLIPASRIVVKFISQTPGPDSKTNPPQGTAEVDVKTGEFTLVTSHRYDDGIVTGEHKVLILGDTGKLVRPEYQKLDKTPLTANSSNSPFEFKLRKP